MSRLMALGCMLEPHTYARSADRQQAYGLLREWTKRADADAAVVARLRDPAQVQRVMWAAAWAHCGFPQVVLGHKLCASLMATKIPLEQAEQMNDLMPPWPAYVVQVPDQLASVFDRTTGREAFVDLLLVERQGGVVLALAQVAETGFLVGRTDSSLAAGTPDLDEASPFGQFAAEPRDVRLTDMMWRLLIGVELEFTDRRRVREPKRPYAGLVRDGRGAPEPVVQNYVLTRDVSMDVRSLVRDHLAGRRDGAPQVQTLVRGHWKSQAHGVGRAGRRWIHVEPYWRGPEDAPIAVRSHVMKRSVIGSGPGQNE